MFSTTKYGPGESPINEQLVQAAKRLKEQLTSTEAKIVDVQAALVDATLQCECLKLQNSSLRDIVNDLTQQVGDSRAEKVAFDLEKAVALASAAGEKLVLSTANSRLQCENEQLEAKVNRLQLDLVKTVSSGVLGRVVSNAASIVAKKTNPAVGTQTEAPVPAAVVGTQTEAPELNPSLAHQSLALVPVSKRNEEGQFKLYQNPFNRSLLTQALNITHRNLALPYTETGYLALVPYQAGGQQTSTAQKASLVSKNFQLTLMNKRLHTEKTKGTILVAGSVVFLVGIGAVIAKNPGAQDTFVKAGQVFASYVLKGVASVSTLVGKILSPNGYVIDLGKNANQ